MRIEDYELEDEEPEKITIEFPNPKKQEVRYPELVRENFVAARWLKKRLGPDSSNMVGQLIQAVRKAEEDNDYEDLEEFVDTFKDE